MKKTPQVKQSDLRANPSHPEHPRWVKESLIEDEATWLSDLGAIPDMRRIETETVATLERLDRKAKMPKRSGKKRPSRRAEKAAENLGYQFSRTADYVEQKAATLRYRDKLQTPREKKLQFRLSLLMRHRVNPLTNTHEPLFPEYCARILNVWARSKEGHGHYAGKTYAERGRIAYTELEKIADDSNRWHGEWNR